MPNKLLIKGGAVCDGQSVYSADVLIEDRHISSVGQGITVPFGQADVVLLDHDDVIFPGFVDVHVHLREPGFSYKETVRTGCAAAAHGGYTAVCAMPNLSPIIDSSENLEKELEIIRRDATVDVYPYGAITVAEQGRELSDMESMADRVVAFSDDGRGVQDDGLMREAMVRARALGKIICAHCEDNSLLRGGYINDGDYARLHGHRGISSESEWRQIERDLRLASETGCAYHICHISCAESVELVRQAKASGIDVTCETAPHYLLLDDTMTEEHGRWKMNPPLRSPSDRRALTEGILDGTVDMIATDHAPHSVEEKSRGLEHSPMGIVGLETAFSSLYTGLVMEGVITLNKLVELMHTAPRARFHIGSCLQQGEPADLTVFDLKQSYAVDPQKFLSLGKSTPFEGRTLFGVCRLTLKNGGIIYDGSSL